MRSIDPGHTCRQAVAPALQSRRSITRLSEPRSAAGMSLMQMRSGIFYDGAPLELLAYDPRKCLLMRSVLGRTEDDHERVTVVRKGVWQAARSLGAFSLMGCSVGPGFEFTDFRFVAKIRGCGRHFTGAMKPFACLL